MMCAPSSRIVFVLILVGSLADPGFADDQGRIRQIEAYVAAYQAMAAFDGVVLIADAGDIVYERAFGKADYRLDVPMTTDGIFRLASLSKQVTQAAIGRLADQGELNVESTLSEFLPEYPNARQITIRQLLDHTAGIAHTNTLDWMQMHRAMTLNDIVAGLAGEPLLFEPGKGSRYSNGGYALLAKVIEVASGRSYADYIAAEFSATGFATIGHEAAYAIVPGMVSRYAPGPVYGRRVEAETYITANRIGGGSLYGAAADVYRFFRASFDGKLLSAATTAQLFEIPPDGDIQITGRSPGALAQIYMDFRTGLTVVTLSSSSAWPGSFNADIVSLYRGEDTTLTPFSLAKEPLSETEAAAVTGSFIAERFDWAVSVEHGEHGLVFVQDNVRTAFAQTTDGEFHLPIYDWLCRYGDYGMEFECRQRDPDAGIRFHFNRR